MSELLEALDAVAAKAKELRAEIEAQIAREMQAQARLEAAVIWAFLLVLGAGTVVLIWVAK